MLSGELGAGKTTFTQGLGAGLRVRGDVTSPTFVISRVHPPVDGGPPLVHVDAYRLGGIDELDDLDLDTSLDDAVTVVEWGEGIAEGLAESRLEIRIIRALAHQDEHADLDPRRVLMTPIGPRWYEMEVPATGGRRWRRSSNENLLVDFRPLRRVRPRDLDPSIPLPLSLMVAEHDGRVLLVHNSWRQEWELPLGQTRSDETARETAVRRFAEETGTARRRTSTSSASARSSSATSGASSTSPSSAPASPGLAQFEATDEVDGLAWWDTVRDYAGLSPIDAHLARAGHRARR